MNSTSNLIEIENLSKSYYSSQGKIDVLNNISFSLKENESLGIVGPSGCGKSSILNIISKLDKHYKGKIEFNKDVKIGYMFQQDALFDWLTVLENSILGLKILKIYNKENKEYTINLLKKYGLYEFKDKYPDELSGGMRQRLALIRTLAIKPNVLLLDEPFSALDFQTRLNVSNDVYNIIKEEKKSFIIVTHDITEAISMCDRVIVLSQRPSIIKNIYNIELKEKKDPISNRNDNNFKKYFNMIWDDINNDI